MDIPRYFPQANFTMPHEKSHDEVIQLGRVLFYDPILSKDNTISCASCHSPYNAFAHTDHELSHGIGDQTGSRNAPALMNLAWHSSFMWDGAVNHIEMQALAPISHAKEMGSSIEEVIDKLKQTNPYPQLFKNAFKNGEISTENVLKSLSLFELTIISKSSKYDSVQLNLTRFTRQEATGYQLFKQQCNTCHQEPLFSTYGFANNGLAVDTLLNDWGRYNVTKQGKDSLTFKIPTLRNLSYTYPYMHDGRFKNLQQVLNHYSKGIHSSPTLAKQLQQGIPMTANEKVDLTAFLLTLNDKSFVFNKSFAYKKPEY